MDALQEIFRNGFDYILRHIHFSESELSSLRSFALHPETLIGKPLQLEASTLQSIYQLACKLYEEETFTLARDVFFVCNFFHSTKSVLQGLVMCLLKTEEYADAKRTAALALTRHQNDSELWLYKALADFHLQEIESCKFALLEAEKHSIPSELIAFHRDLKNQIDRLY